MSQETMKVTQALISAGGTGSRLRNGGVDVPGSKSMIQVEGKPLLYWCVKGLIEADITRFVIASESSEGLRTADKIVEDAVSGNDIQEVVLFQDQGKGATRLPTQVRDQLDEAYFYENGQRIGDPSHYEAMKAQKTPETIVYSAYDLSSNTNRPIFPVDRETGLITLQETETTDTRIIEGPWLLDQHYAENLPDITVASPGYAIHVIRSYVERGKAKAVNTHLPVEIDTVDEYKKTMPIYENYIRQSLKK